MAATLRFAPSPNGRLHLGHVYSARLNAELAEKLGGKFLLRIEDIDTTRCTSALTEACMDDLAWLGFRWETPVRIQSEHFADYAAAQARLMEQGLLYPCFCTRRQVEETSTARDPDGAPIYSGTCKHLVDAQSRIAAGEAHAWRLDMAKAISAPLEYVAFSLPETTLTAVSADPAVWGDAVLVRKDTPTSYHLSVVVDDALQGITHVVRGQDLEASTSIHVLLQRLLGLPTPLYHHHELLQDDEGRKLSKSLSSRSIAELRAAGETPESVLGLLP